MDTIQSLRKLALRLEPSGTAIPISSTKLYVGGYGFVGLQVYVPITSNRAADSKPLCTVHRTTIDSFGNRKQFAQEKFSLKYVEEVTLAGARYLLFEQPLPKPFTDTEGELELVINYSEIGENALGEPVVLSRLTTNIYRTKVEAGVVGDGETITDLKGLEAAQINANTIAIESLVDSVEGLLLPPDDMLAGLVGTPTVTLAADGRFQFAYLKGEPGVNATIQWGDDGPSPISTLGIKEI